MIELFIGLPGLIIGSFINVCIYRLPINESITFPPSHCTKCKKRLKYKDLVPLISYIFLKGRCRYCGIRITTRYPIVELLTACLFLWCYGVVGLSGFFLKSIVLTSFLVVITYIDYDHQLILDKMLVWLAGIGVVINLLTGYVSSSDMLFASLMAGGILLIIAIISHGGMGGGDIKFAAALGLWLGVKITLLTLLISFILGGLCGVFVLIFRLKSRKDFIPFGPFLAIGTFISLLYGNTIIDWYITRFL